MSIKYLTHAAEIRCMHGGKLQLFPPIRRSLYSGGSPILTDVDLLAGVIVGCPLPFTPCLRVALIMAGPAKGAIVDRQVPLLMTLQAVTDRGAECRAVFDPVTNLEVEGVLVTRPSVETTEDRPKWECFVIALAKALFWLAAAIAATYAVVGVTLAVLLSLGVAATFAQVCTAVAAALATVFVLYEMYIRHHQYVSEYGRSPGGWKQVAMFGASLLALTGATSIIEGLRSKRFFSDKRLSSQEHCDAIIGGIIQLAAIIGPIIARVRGRVELDNNESGMIEQINRGIEKTIRDFLSRLKKPETEHLPGSKFPMPIYSKQARLQIVFDRLQRLPRAKSPEEAMTQMNTTLNTAEDEFSGLPYEPIPGNNGRMYPAQADRTKTAPDGTITARSRGHVTTYGPDGSIKITESKTGQLVFSKP